MSYFGHIGSYSSHIVPHSFFYLKFTYGTSRAAGETPAVFTHSKLANLSKIPTGIFTMCSDYLILKKNIAVLILCLYRA
jgi:hypothetical protein